MVRAGNSNHLARAPEEPPPSVFTNGKIGTEEREPIPHYGQHVSDFLIGTGFQTLPELRPDPERPKPFEKIVRSCQPSQILEQFFNGIIFRREVLQFCSPLKVYKPPLGIDYRPFLVEKPFQK